MLKVAILDDYQNVSHQFVDIEKLAGKYQHKGYFILPAPEKSISSFTKGNFTSVVIISSSKAALN